MTRLRSIGWRTAGIRRLNTSNWRVNDAALLDARRISRSSARTGSVHLGVEESFRVAEDDGEQVVEVVGDGAGQPAERLHLLAVPELFLEMFAIGDVARVGDTIVRALRESNGVVAGPNGAAARLGVKRTTLQSKMRKLGIRRPGY
jgi:transcriptional regulator with GAF, ATPase, and Fis domain